MNYPIVMWKSLILTSVGMLLIGCKSNHSISPEQNDDRKYVMRSVANFTSLFEAIQDCSLPLIERQMIAKKARDMFLIGEHPGIIEIQSIRSENQTIMTDQWLQRLAIETCDNERYEIEKIEVLIGRDMRPIGVDQFGRQEFEVLCEAYDKYSNVRKVYKHRCKRDEILQLRPSEPLVKFKKVTLSQHR